MPEVVPLVENGLVLLRQGERSVGDEIIDKTRLFRDGPENIELILLRRTRGIKALFGDAHASVRLNRERVEQTIETTGLGIVQMHGFTFLDALLQNERAASRHCLRD